MNWKDRLYQYYVSSEQGGQGVSSSTNHFEGNRPYIERLIRRHFPSGRDARILDIGCGHGTYLYFAKRSGYKNIKGIDFSAEQVAIAHQIGLSEVTQEDLDAYLRDANEKFDVIMMMDILEHLEPQQLFDALDRVSRLLSPSARLIIHVPNAEGIFGMRIRYGDYTHTQAFTPRSIRQVLLTLGFADIRCYEDKPVRSGLIGLIRHIIWNAGTLGFRLLLMAETGEKRFILTQNMLVVATRKTESVH
jgi:2-polyprenyl-3-methyl-5-hydroxy-6-metoxy-1,4-benzoquinol methylase